MRWVTDNNHPSGLNFILEEDPQAGFYALTYNDPNRFTKDVVSPDRTCFNHHDSLLEATFEEAKEAARKVFGIDPETWRELD